MKRLRLLFIAAAGLLFAISTADARGGGGHVSSHFPITHSTKSGSATAKKSTGDHAVHGYTTKKGTTVNPYRATNPNKTKNDNYSTKGNVNPYTGKKGTKKRDGG